MRFTVGDLTWNVVVEGPPSGPTVLLLHGFPDTAELWRPQINALTASGFRVIAPDMLGFGDTDKPQEPAPYTLRNQCMQLVQILDQLGQKSVKLVGHDWGAAVAWLFAIMYPDRVERLAALSVGHPGGGVAAGGNRQRARWWYMLFFKAFGGEAEAAMQADNWQFFREFMAGESKAVVDAYIRTLEPPGALTAALNWYRANVSVPMFASTKLRPFPPLQCPVIGVWGSADVALAEPQMTVSEQYVQPGLWQYHRIDGAGHWLQRDAPEVLNQLLIGFLVAQQPKL